jgi:hypothetical protein
MNNKNPNIPSPSPPPKKKKIDPLGTCWHTSLAGKNFYALADMFLHLFWPKLMTGASILGHRYSYLRASSSEGKNDTFISNLLMYVIFRTVLIE